LLPTIVSEPNHRFRRHRIIVVVLVVVVSPRYDDDHRKEDEKMKIKILKKTPTHTIISNNITFFLQTSTTIVTISFYFHSCTAYSTSIGN